MPRAADVGEKRKEALPRRGGRLGRRGDITRSPWIAVRTTVASTGVDNTVGEEFVSAALLGVLVVAELGLTQTSQQLFGTREIGKDVFGDEEIGAVEDSEETREGDVGIVARQHTNGVENRVRVGRDVFKAEAEGRVEVA